MNSPHYEAIECPNCNSTEIAEVEHTYPHWNYTHFCDKCNYVIQESEWNMVGQLFNDNMEDVLKEMNSNTPRYIVITDPPYGTRTDIEWDDEQHFKTNISIWLNECMRVTEHTVIWFCANKMFPYIMRNIKPSSFHRQHYWNKPPGAQFNGAQTNNIWYSSEPILIFTKDRKKTTTNYDNNIAYNYDGLVYDTVPKSIWNHPTTKPIELMAQLILHYTKPEDIVVDPFGGSGSTIEACIKTGRKYIYIDKDKDHFNTAMNRIKALVNQTDLFTEASPKKNTKKDKNQEKLL